MAWFERSGAVLYRTGSVFIHRICERFPNEPKNADTNNACSVFFSLPQEWSFQQCIMYVCNVYLNLTVQGSYLKLLTSGRPFMEWRPGSLQWWILSCLYFAQKFTAKKDTQVIRIPAASLLTWLFWHATTVQRLLFGSVVFMCFWYAALCVSNWDTLTV